MRRLEKGDVVTATVSGRPRIGRVIFATTNRVDVNVDGMHVVRAREEVNYCGDTTKRLKDTIKRERLKEWEILAVLKGAELFLQEEKDE